MMDLLSLEDFRKATAKTWEENSELKGSSIEDLYYHVMENNSEYEIPYEVCPVCQLKVVEEWVFVEHLFRLVSGEKTKEEIKKEILESFGSYEELKKHYKSSKS
jgi:superoxide dismutase